MCVCGGDVDVEISTHHPLFVIAECVYITNRKRYCCNVEWTRVLLLGIAQTLVAGSDDGHYWPKHVVSLLEYTSFN